MYYSMGDGLELGRWMPMPMTPVRQDEWGRVGEPGRAWLAGIGPWLLPLETR